MSNHLEREMNKERTSADRPGEIVRDPTWAAAWETEENYWFENFSSRPYALGPDFYDRFRPAFRYGFDSAHHSMGRNWAEAEPDLRAGWDRYEHRGAHASAWDEIKDAVRDAWERVVSHRSAEKSRGS
jgi:hypothetical protein